jgi:hypothetical protein
MTYFSKFSGADIDKILDGRLHSPIQDVIGDNWTSTPGEELIMAAGQKYRFRCNGNIRNKLILPEHLTAMWDTDADITTFSDMLNTPMMVFSLGGFFIPDTASEGLFTATSYVNETTPIPFKPRSTAFKSTPSEVSVSPFIYTGDDVGFDVKNKGVYFEIEVSKSGKFHTPAIELYRT